MKIEVHEKKHKPLIVLQREKKIILTQEEYENFKTAFCRGNGWSQDYPHTVNVHSITVKGNYKWMPKSSVEFLIEIEGQENDPKKGIIK